MAVREEPSFGFERLLEKHPEWIISFPDGSLFPAISREIALIENDSETQLEFPTDFGLRRVVPTSIEISEDSISISFVGGEEGALGEVVLIPRLEATGVRTVLEEARLQRIKRIADALETMEEPLRPRKFESPADGGRLVKIFCEDRWRRERIVFADISDSLTPEYLVTTALLELDSLSRRKPKDNVTVALVASRSVARGAVGLRSALRGRWASSLDVIEVAKSGGDEILLKKITQTSVRSQRNRGKGREVPRGNQEVVPEVESLISSVALLAPEAVDSIFSMSGWTVRYHGLPFLRIRIVNNSTRCWIGVGSRRREIAVAEMLPVVEELIASIAEYRRHDPPTRRHEYYRLAPEAWLESLLLRNIQRLDPNLILSPVHTQYKAGPDRIDMLALRADGRPVIIEVKVSLDREAVFQTVDYWRKLEIARGAGSISYDQLFPGRRLEDKQPVIYIVTPFLSVHPDFDFLVGCLDPQIRICRFDLNEDWRRQITLHQRTEY